MTSSAGICIILFFISNSQKLVYGIYFKTLRADISLLVLTRLLSFSLSHVARYAPLLKGQNASSILRKSISSNFFELLKSVIDGFAKREKCQFHQFEMLKAKRYSDNCNTKEESPPEMRESNTKASDEPSYHIHYSCETSRRPTIAYYVSAERHKATVANFVVWSPNGIPTMVIIINTLDIAYSMAIIRPPNISHIRLSKRFIRKLSTKQYC